MEVLLRDIRQAVRALGKQPGLTLTALTMLALGIGANVAMFGIVNAMLLRPLPYPDPEAIVRIGEVLGPQSRSSPYLSNKTMPRIEEEAESFEQVAAYLPRGTRWRGPERTITLSSAQISPSLFPLLRARLHLGRFFTEDEARTGANRVVVLSHGAWTRRFGSDPNIVSGVVNLDGAPHTVVGVAAEGFYFPTPDAEVWTPFVIPPSEFSVQTGPGGEDLRVATTVSFNALGRLRPGVSPQQAATETRTILQQGRNVLIRGFAARGLSRQLDSGADDTPETDAVVIPLQEELTAQYRPALFALTVAMALVLLIACINVAGLLLARGITRQRALAVCAALGAGRGRILRQLLTESVVLSLGGGAIGLAAAAVVLRTVPALVPGDIARLDEAGIDGMVLAFTLGLSVLVGLIFGTAPALQWSRFPLLRTLNEGSAQSTGGFRLLRSSRTRAALATAQVALALVLLIGAGLLLRSFVGLLTVDRGYHPANVITARVENPDARFELGAMPTTLEAMDQIVSGDRWFAETLIDATDRLAGLPGMEAVGLSTGLPPGSRDVGAASVHIEGRPPVSNPAEMPFASIHVASPGYFDVMRLRLRSGRFYTERDGAGSPHVIVVNETFAREVLGGESPVGQRVRFGARAPGEPWEVIGVVADIRYEGIADTSPQPEMFVPTGQMEDAPVFSSGQFIAVRTTGDPLAAVPFLREAVTEAHPRATVDNVMTMDARLSAAIAQPRFYAGFVGFFAALALFLAAFGLYGLLSYTIAQRRREIGVRMALGAQRGNIVTLVVRQGALLVAVGAVAGLVAAAASSRVLASFLYGIATDDGLTFAAAPLVLVAVALVACWLPARRATRIDPMQALRVD